jgi:hypothetical protein
MDTSFAQHATSGKPAPLRAGLSTAEGWSAVDVPTRVSAQNPKVKAASLAIAHCGFGFSRRFELQ